MAEQNVRWPQDAEKLEDSQIKGGTPLMASDVTDEDKLAYITHDQLAGSVSKLIEIKGIEVKPIAGGATSATAVVLPAGPAGQNRKMTGVVGWFKNATGSPWEAKQGYDNTNWWDGTTWSLGSSIPYPKGADGKTIELYDPTKADGYVALSQILEDGILYQVKTGQSLPTGQAPSANPTKVTALGRMYSINENGDYMYVIADGNNNLLAFIDSKGFFNASFANESIPAAAMVGGKIVTDVIRETQTENYLLNFTDKEDNILARFDNKGIFNSAGISTEKVIYKGEEVDLNNLDKSNDVITDKELVVIRRDKFFRVEVQGALPTDMSVNRNPTNVVVAIKDYNEITIAKFNGKMSIQGHGSATYDKKGYTLDIFNINGDAVKLKIGNMIPTDSFHLKAYYSDSTHSRDVSCGRIWRDMIRQLDYPRDMVHNKPFVFSKVSSKKADAYHADAQFHTDGVPFVMNVNGKFQGLYTWRLKKTRENYAIDRDNKSHIYLDSVSYTAYLREPFDYTDWEAKSPKMTGYGGEGAPIPDSTVLANINRLFGFTSNLATQFANHANYIVLDHWVIFAIHGELFGNWDINGNNLNLLTWNATQWTIIPYDMDSLLGLQTGGSIMEETKTGMIMLSDIWPTFKTVYLNEIKAMYTKLRKSGFINHGRLMAYFTEQVNGIPQDVYADDKKKWGVLWNVGTNETTIEQISIWLNSRIQYLDTQWLIS